MKRKEKKLVALLLIAVLLVSSVAFAKDFPLERYLDNTPSDEQFEFAMSDLAYVMSSQGYFSGTEKGFQLDKPLTRAEAVTLLIKLSNKVEVAKTCNYEISFTDVPNWAKQYVSYAKEKGLTNGISETLFGSQMEVTANQFATLLLRLLKYTEVENDFIFSHACEKLFEVIELPDFYIEKINTENFTRKDVLLLAYYTLMATPKGSETSLVEETSGHKTISVNAKIININKLSINRYAPVDNVKEIKYNLKRDTFPKGTEYVQVENMRRDNTKQLESIVPTLDRFVKHDIEMYSEERLEVNQLGYIAAERYDEAYQRRTQGFPKVDCGFVVFFNGNGELFGFIYLDSFLASNIITNNLENQNFKHIIFLT